MAISSEPEERVKMRRRKHNWGGFLRGLSSTYKKRVYNANNTMGEYERVRYTVLRHGDSGRYAMVDQFIGRLEKLRMRIIAWAELVEKYQKKNDVRLIMVTLTYAKKDDYKSGHIRKYIKALKQKMGGEILAWAWVAEIQKRGAVHYHLTVLIPKGTRFPTPDKSGMWKWGMSNVKNARSAWYLVKYVGKAHQKDLSRYPKGCRLYATSIRFGGKETKELYRRHAGLKYPREAEGWNYIGSCITEKYGKAILANGELS